MRPVGPSRPGPRLGAAGGTGRPSISYFGASSSNSPRLVASTTSTRISRPSAAARSSSPLIPYLRPCASSEAAPRLSRKATSASSCSSESRSKGGMIGWNPFTTFASGWVMDSRR